MKKLCPICNGDRRYQKTDDDWDCCPACDGLSHSEPSLHTQQLKTMENTNQGSSAIALGAQLARLEKWTDKYHINFQFWGKGYNQVFIEKDYVDVYSSAQHETILDALTHAVEWIHRVNNYQEEVNPNF